MLARCESAALDSRLARLPGNTRPAAAAAAHSRYPEIPVLSWPGLALPGLASPAALTELELFCFTSSSQLDFAHHPSSLPLARSPASSPLRRASTANGLNPTRAGNSLLASRRRHPPRRAKSDLAARRRRRQRKCALSCLRADSPILDLLYTCCCRRRRRRRSRAAAALAPARKPSPDSIAEAQPTSTTTASNIRSQAAQGRLSDKMRAPPLPTATDSPVLSGGH